MTRCETRLQGDGISGVPVLDVGLVDRNYVGRSRGGQVGDRTRKGVVQGAWETEDRMDHERDTGKWHHYAGRDRRTLGTV